MSDPTGTSPPKPASLAMPPAHTARERTSANAVLIAAVPPLFALACFAAAILATPPGLRAAQRAAAALSTSLGTHLPTLPDPGATILWPPTTPLSPESQALGPNASLAPPLILDAALGSLELFGLPHPWLWLSLAHIALTAAALSAVPPLLRPRLPLHQRPRLGSLPGIAAVTALLALPILSATLFIHQFWTAQVDEPTPLATSAGLGPLGVAGIYAGGLLAYAAIVLTTIDARATRCLRQAALDRALCAACGYPIANLDQCPECGRNTARSPTLLLFRPLLLRAFIAVIAWALLACSPLWLTWLAAL